MDKKRKEKRTKKNLLIIEIFLEKKILEKAKTSRWIREEKHFNHRDFYTEY